MRTKPKAVQYLLHAYEFARHEKEQEAVNYLHLSQLIKTYGVGNNTVVVYAEQQMDRHTVLWVEAGTCVEGGALYSTTLSPVTLSPPQGRCLGCLLAAQ